MNAAENDRQVLTIRDLKVNFNIGRKKKVNAIREVSLSLSRGETLCLVGESGCGKSVTATTIMRLLPRGIGEVECGEILLEGRDLLKMTVKEMDRIRGNEISMIFQDPMTSLNPVYTIGKQLEEILLSHRKISRREAEAECIRMLKKVGIPAAEERMHKYPHELSGGMRQRVMIAMALLTNPKVLIADEPTTALDVTIQAQILNLIRQLQKEYNTGVILITHDMGVVAENADRVAVMYAGEVMEYDTAKEIFTNPRHPYTRGLLRSIPRFDQKTDRLPVIEGMVPPLEQMLSGCRFSSRCPYAQERCKQEHPRLTACGETKSVRCHRTEEILTEEDKYHA